MANVVDLLNYVQLAQPVKSKRVRLQGAQDDTMLLSHVTDVPQPVVDEP